MSEKADIVEFLDNWGVCEPGCNGRRCTYCPSEIAETIKAEIERLRSALASAEAAALDRAAQVVEAYADDGVEAETVARAIRRLLPAGHSPAPAGEAEMVTIARGILKTLIEQAEAMAYERCPQDFEQFGPPAYLADARAALASSLAQKEPQP